MRQINTFQRAALDTPAYTPEEAATMGAFAEDAISLQDAYDSIVDDHYHEEASCDAK